MPSLIRTDTINYSLPRQRVTIRQKTDKRKRESVDSVIQMSRFHPGTSENNWDLVNRTYDYYNGIIDDADYTHVMKPYGKSMGNFPAKLHNYSIIKPNIDLLRGEFAKRPLNYTVIVSNPDVVTNREEQRKSVIEANIKQHFINELNNYGIDTGVDSNEDIELPEDIARSFDRSYKDNRAIMGQEALQFIIYHSDVFTEFKEAFFHFLVSGRVFTLRTIIQDEIHYETLDPLDFDFDKSPSTTFIEDGMWAINRKLCVPSDVIDSYYDELTTAQIDQIENPMGGQSESHFLSGFSDSNEGRTRFIEVYRVYWKSMMRFITDSNFSTFLLNGKGTYRRFLNNGIEEVKDEKPVKIRLPNNSLSNVEIIRIKNIYGVLSPHIGRINYNDDLKLVNSLLKRALRLNGFRSGEKAVE